MYVPVSYLGVVCEKLTVLMIEFEVGWRYPLYRTYRNYSIGTDTFLPAYIRYSKYPTCLRYSHPATVSKYWQEINVRYLSFIGVRFWGDLI